MDIYYLNTQGDKIVLSEWPIAVTDLTQLFGRKWEVVANESVLKKRSRLQYITRTSKEFDVDITVYADSISEYQDLMNNFEDVTDYDVRAQSPGRLYVGEWYLECFIRDTAPEDFEELFDEVDVTLTIHSLYPHWIKEDVYTFGDDASSWTPEVYPPRESGGDYAPAIAEYYTRPDYKYDYTRPSDKNVIYAEKDYKFDYKPSLGYYSVINPLKSDMEFVMVIHGYALNPSIVIGDHTYYVEAVVYENEYLVIDGRNNTITKVDAYGNETNLFNSRGKDSSVFEALPAGELQISYPGTYQLDLTLYEERSEPEWIL